ncbi:hypothetical protein AVEN_142634-1 [Araneus ventricosus]|uniref:Uncharacterized protein n=1 Tax=Araneus ventricosus TaxID=182803 RepID=A0A4Y2SMH5_ARAVE|nr:hypothetical protein AVEN_142634-1 [Araneus ventricosus]
MPKTDFRCNVFPDSNFSLQQRCSNLALQICKLATNLTRQKCKLEKSYRKRVSHHASNLSPACLVKLIANYSKNSTKTTLYSNPRHLVSLTCRPNHSAS